MPEFTVEELKSKTLEELAVLSERSHPQSAERFLIENEQRSRLVSSVPVRRKRWFERPAGIVILSIVGSLLAAALLYLLDRI